MPPRAIRFISPSLLYPIFWADFLLITNSPGVSIAGTVSVPRGDQSIGIEPPFLRASGTSSNEPGTSSLSPAPRIFILCQSGPPPGSSGSK